MISYRRINWSSQTNHVLHERKILSISGSPKYHVIPSRKFNEELQHIIFIQALNNIYSDNCFQQK